MKKTYQKFLWISYIVLFIVGFLVSVSVIVGTLFLLFSDEDLVLKGLMSTLSCVMLLYGLAENTRDFNHGMNRIQL
ncbi:hypothetical protein [Enterococcus faecium]|uniref:hypothetical protein n=1 Tax=Enterococcus faecium TaxID=1352 RepID=UPI000763D65A|nr:hypothetical protein [Enterococcus faecium]KWY09515.1 hypothetical protein AS227_06790 [Enterococcus faecium]